jgi:uncharacterized protein
MKYGFFILAFALMFALFSYVHIRGIQLFPHGTARVFFSASYIFLLILMFLGLFLDHQLSQSLSSVLTSIGYTYFLVVIYMAMSFLLTDLVRLVHHFTPFTADNMLLIRQWSAAGSIVLITIVLIIGGWKFNHPVVVEQDIVLEKNLPRDELTIVAASDLHLGNGIGKKHLDKYVRMINEQKPDLILLLGDLTDRSLGPVLQQHLQEELLRLKAPLGIYAIRGNHEYYSGKPDAISLFLQESGIRLLRDSACLVDDSFYLIGRDDRTNPERKNLQEIVAGLEQNRPKILLDHQPYQLEEAEKNGIDLQLSGHTHDGQFFPFSLVVRSMFEKAHGYHRRGNTHYYISSGLGIWGPLYRIGTQSELVVIHLKSVDAQTNASEQME